MAETKAQRKARRAKEHEARMLRAKGELLPPQPPIVISTPPAHNSANWRAAFFFLVGALVAVIGGAFSNYLQTRGFLSVTLARTFLGITWVAAATLVVVGAMAFTVRKRALTIIGGVSVLTAILVGLEVWASSQPHAAPPAGTTQDTAKAFLDGFRQLLKEQPPTQIIDNRSYTSPPTKAIEPVVRLRFSEDLFFTPTRKKAFTDEINRFYRYVINLGLTPPPDCPEITFGNQTILTTGGTNSPYSGAIYSSLSIADESADQPQAVLGPYADYIFSVTMEPVDSRHRGTLRNIFAEYFVWSFTSKAKGKSPMPFLRALRFLRDRRGQDEADTIVTNALRGAIGESRTGDEPDFNNFAISALTVQPLITGKDLWMMDIYEALNQAGFVLTEGRWHADGAKIQ